MSESDVCRRKILTSKVYPRTVRVSMWLMARSHLFSVFGNAAAAIFAVFLLKVEITNNFNYISR